MGIFSILHLLQYRPIAAFGDTFIYTGTCAIIRCIIDIRSMDLYACFCA